MAPLTNSLMWSLLPSNRLCLYRVLYRKLETVSPSGEYPGVVFLVFVPFRKIFATSPRCFFVFGRLDLLGLVKRNPFIINFLINQCEYCLCFWERGFLLESQYEIIFKLTN